MEGKRQEMMKSHTDRQHQAVDWKEVGRSGQNGRHERRSVVPIFRNEMSPHHEESPCTLIVLNNRTDYNKGL